MQKIDFVKAVASGNDFIIIQATSYTLIPLYPYGHRRAQAGTGKLQATGSETKQSRKSLNYKKIAKELCQRKFGIGADGLLVVEPSQKADFRMRIFNPDGSEAEMCGNGVRCVALWATSHKSYPNTLTGTSGHRQITNHTLAGTGKSKIDIETKAGIIQAEIKSRYSLLATRYLLKVKMPQPKNLKLDIPVKIDKKTIKVNFVEVGVPQAVIFVKNLENIDVQNLGRKIREHQEFQPAGTNVNFVEVLTEDSIRIRTYERGVEGETFSCGTGSVASALIAHCSLLIAKNKIKVYTQGEILKVYLDKQLKDIYLEGEARIVYEGVYTL